LCSRWQFIGMKITGCYVNIITTVDQLLYFNSVLILSTQYLPHVILEFRKKT
jgi:hypothetical protein